MAYEIIQGNGSGDFVFCGVHRDAARCKAPEVMVAGPADTGKTISLLHKLHLCACKYPGASIVILRRRQTDAYATVIQTFLKKVINPRPPQIVPYGGENKPEWFEYANGSRIWVAGLDKPGKVLSGEHDILYVNQAEEMELPGWETLATRVTGRAGNMPYAQIIGDCNPAHPSHWIMQRSRSGVLKRFDTTHRDNPDLYNQETGEIIRQGKQRIERLKNLTGARRKRLYLGLWAAPEGAIFEVFDETKHKCQAFQIPRAWGKFTGVDPVGAYVAVVWVAYDQQSQIFHVYREYCEPFGVPTKTHVKNILDANQGDLVAWWATGGPSERQQRLDFQSHGLPVSAPGISDVWAGIDRIIEALDTGQLVIHDSCPGLLSDIGGYRRKMNKDGQPMERTIEDKDSFHLLDCLRYALVGPETYQEDTVIYSPVRIR